RNEDRDRSYAGAAVQPEALLQPQERADDQGQREQLLDDLEAPQDLAEDSSGEVAGSDLPEDDGSRERDQERAPDPEGEAESNHLRGGGRGGIEPLATRRPSRGSLLRIALSSRRVTPLPAGPRRDLAHCRGHPDLPAGPLLLRPRRSHGGLLGPRDVEVLLEIAALRRRPPAARLPRHTFRRGH